MSPPPSARGGGSAPTPDTDTPRRDAGPQRLPLVPPLAALVAALASWPLPRPLGVGGRLRLERIEPTPQGLCLHLRVSGTAGLLDGTYRMAITVLGSTPEESSCRIELLNARGLSSLLRAGLGVVPADWINALLGRFSKDAMRIEGHTVRIRHQALLRELLRRSS